MPFSPEIEPLVLSLASQAAVSLENNKLYQNIEKLFEHFVNASVKAIESRDPTTSGHSGRVADYTVGLAQAVDRGGAGTYRDVHFSAEQIKEIKYASLLHDFGKVGVREHVLVKAKKLYPSQLEMVKMRFAYIRKARLQDLWRKRFELLSEDPQKYLARKAELDRVERDELEKLDAYLQTIMAADVPTVLAEDAPTILDEIHGKSYTDEDGTTVPFLTDDEHTKLRVQRGSLDPEEWKQIQDHVSHTYAFLSKIPWSMVGMGNIPTIAYGHHEKLDGGGYPRRLQATDIPVQSRMMTVSDIYDALTASDRPYKPAVPPRKALDILVDEVRHDKLDRELVDIFIEAKVWEKMTGKQGS